jgi:hypothetical protein
LIAVGPRVTAQKSINLRLSGILGVVACSDFFSYTRDIESLKMIGLRSSTALLGLHRKDTDHIEELVKYCIDLKDDSGTKSE